MAEGDRRLDGILSLLPAEPGAAYLVGGYVRDLILDRPNQDVDVAVKGDGLELARRLADKTGGRFFALDPERKTGRIVYPGGQTVSTVDIAAWRAAGIEDDLKDRDFTINAFGIDVARFRAGHRFPADLLDPTGGLPDLKHGVIRAVSDGVFQDDPARLIRAFRLQVMLGFAIETATMSAISRDAPLLGRIPGERIREELARILALPDTATVFSLMASVKLMDQLFPELAPARGVKQNEWHHLDVWEHSLFTVACLEDVLAGLSDYFGADAPRIERHLAEELQDGVSRRSVLKLVAVLHDAGKPATRTVGSDGRVHFYGHADVGVRLASEALRRLRFSESVRRLAVRVLAEHMRPGFLADMEQPTQRAVGRMLRDAGDDLVDIVVVSVADRMAGRGPATTERALTRHRAAVRDLARRYSQRSDFVEEHPPLVNGDDVMAELGVGPGPLVGRVLATIREAQLAGRLRSRNEALRLIKKYGKFHRSPNISK